MAYFGVAKFGYPLHLRLSTWKLEEGFALLVLLLRNINDMLILTYIWDLISGIFKVECNENHISSYIQVNTGHRTETRVKESRESGEENVYIIPFWN